MSGTRILFGNTFSLLCWVVLQGFSSEPPKKKQTWFANCKKILFVRSFSFTFVASRIHSRFRSPLKVEDTISSSRERKMFSLSRHWRTILKFRWQLEAKDMFSATAKCFSLNVEILLRQPSLRQFAFQEP